MIHKLHICIDGKLILNKFSINIHDNQIIINLLNNINSEAGKKVSLDNIIKVPIFNKYNGIDYFPIHFPLKMIILKDYVFNPYIILSTYNFNFDNTIDFFYNIDQLLNKKYNLKLLKFNELDTHNFDTINIVNTYFTNTLTLDNLNYNEKQNEKQNENNINKFTNDLWFDINIIKLSIIFILVKFPNISNKNIKEIAQKHNYPKKILTISNQIKNFKYTLTNNDSDYNMNFIEYHTCDFKTLLNISDIKINNYYYIIINKCDNSNTTVNATVTATDINNISNVSNINKVIKIFVYKLDKNIISIGDSKNVIFENYKWYYYHPNNNINKDYIIYQTFINNKFTCEIIRNLFNIELLHCNKIIDYYQINNKQSNIIILSKLFKNLEKTFDDISILKSNSYTDGFFEYLTKKYSTADNPIIYEILNILFERYNYPLKINRHDLDNTFDQILYFSLYNYKQILILSKNNGFFNYTNDILNPTVNNIIPIKLKNLYINLLKTLTHIINNDFESITYNQKFYYDYLHKSIIKIFFTESTKLSITLFKNLITPNIFVKFKNIVCTNILLIDIANKLSWNTIPKKLNYLNIFYKNNNLLFYQDKINKNIIPDNFDSRIKKIIENPFEMYKYLKKEKDFEKWTKFISDKIMQIYHIPISISSDDFDYIGKLIYLLFNINEQNIKDPTYIVFINFCNVHSKLILESNRVNIKIRECFPNLKTNINLGFLAKHLTWDKDSISFDEQIENNEKSEDILALEIKLHAATKKYYKYKAKYLESKDIDVTSALITYNQNKIQNKKEKEKENDSITSSVIPGYKKISNI